MGEFMIGVVLGFGFGAVGGWFAGGYYKVRRKAGEDRDAIAREAAEKFRAKIVKAVEDNKAKIPTWGD